MENEYVEAARKQFTPLLCRQIVWAIHEAMVEYFSTKLRPEHFAQGADTPWPETDGFEDVYKAIRYGTPIPGRRYFPAEWLITAPRGGGGRGGSTGSGSGGGSSNFSNNSSNNNNANGRNMRQQQNYNRNANGNGNGGGRSNGGADPLGHCHHVIRRWLGNFHRKFAGRVQMGRLCQLSNVGIGTLPSLPRYFQGGTNMMCYTYVLGVCPMTATDCNYTHANSSDLPEQFCTDLCNCLRPGIEHMLNGGTPAAPGGTGGRNGNNGGGGGNNNNNNNNNRNNNNNNNRNQQRGGGGGGGGGSG